MGEPRNPIAVSRIRFVEHDELRRIDASDRPGATFGLAATARPAACSSLPSVLLLTDPGPRMVAPPSRARRLRHPDDPSSGWPLPLTSPSHRGTTWLRRHPSVSTPGRYRCVVVRARVGIGWVNDPIVDGPRAGASLGLTGHYASLARQVWAGLKLWAADAGVDPDVVDDGGLPGRALAAYRDFQAGNASACNGGRGKRDLYVYGSAGG